MKLAIEDKWHWWRRYPDGHDGVLMLEGQHERLPDAHPVKSDVDALELCPYSEETIAGCRYYHPLSAHGDFPDAGHCTDAFVISGTDHIRYAICGRGAGSVVRLRGFRQTHR